jgi:hypothetical protein
MGIDPPCILFLDDLIIRGWRNPCLFLYSKGPACRAFTVQSNLQFLVILKLIFRSKRDHIITRTAIVRVVG